MPFIGAQPATTFAKATSQVFTNANGSLVDFTLNKHVSQPEDIEVFVSNVQQQPTTSYTILSDGVTLRFSEAPPSGDFYVVYRNLAQQTGTDTGAFRKTGGTITGLLTTTGDLTVSRAETNGTVRLNLSNTGSNGSSEYSEIKLSSTAGTAATSIFQHRNNYGLNVGTTTDHPVYFLQNNANAMAINTDGNVGIGTSSPASPLGANFKSLDINSGVWGGTVNFSGNSGGYIGNRHSGNGGLGYYAASGQGHDFAVNGTVTSVLNIESDGDVNVKTGNLIIGTSGKGIDFSAQTGGLAVASGDGTENPTTENEVLKHYEHGTFKPKIVSSGATFNYQGSGDQYGSGHYTRIGDIVFIDINMDSDSGVSGTLTNSIQIQNLPFTGHTGTSMNIQYFYRRVSDSSHPHVMAQQYSNYISFLQSPDSGQWRSLTANQINFSDHRMKISGCYHIGSV